LLELSLFPGPCSRFIGLLDSSTRMESMVSYVRLL